MPEPENDPRVSPATAAQRRAHFAEAHADGLAGQVGAVPSTRQPNGPGRSPRYVWFSQPDALTLVVGDQERGHVDTALAIGLSQRGDRALRLVLPRGWHEPTLHRWPWLRDELPLEVWAHAGGEAIPQPRPTREATKELAVSGEEPALHLGTRTGWVENLMRWAGDQPELDPAHRQSTRAWQCRGQRVLRIARTGPGLTVVAGIDWGQDSPHQTPQPLQLSGPLLPADLNKVIDQVRAGCEQRLVGVARKADEHWLQAVLRRQPGVLGLEQPALRELPAWRPAGSQGVRTGAARSRGFVDLAGLDATGTLTLVETKLGGDDMLTLQGLDYLIWAEANRARLTDRLDCSRHVPFEIAYCVGGKPGGAPAWSGHALPQLQAVAPDLRWHVQEITGWFDGPAISRRTALCTFVSAEDRNRAVDPEPG